MYIEIEMYKGIAFIHRDCLLSFLQMGGRLIWHLDFDSSLTGIKVYRVVDTSTPLYLFE